ncbi:MAG TPA: non-canonical purine NTP diphosphatase [Bacteroidales bacterium]|nr:non-canonical purine NTP diphosphatase [Bacteroidales bacterium]
MKKIVFATHNAHKLEEVRAILKNTAKIVGLADIGCHEDIPETADTLEGNAKLKSQYIYEKFGYDCISDDTGLEIEALNGKPGVLSARYAGEPSNSVNNMLKVLEEMKDKSNRNAQFRTVISLVENGKYCEFEGIVKGKISREPSGKGGFGYDPIFIPEGYSGSFAELSADVKNAISHRALAINKLVKWIRDN